MNSFEIIQTSIDKNCYKIPENTRKIDLLIFHHIQANSYEETIEALEYHGVSANYLIDKNGKIVQIVDDNNIAYHAGVSYWNEFENLNNNSLGIEMINSNPFENNFSEKQMESAIILAKYLIDKYQILPRYILGHSDIAYHRDSNFLDRKQDPSHLFDWQLLAQNNIGLYPNIKIDEKEILKFEINDIDNEIANIKQKLKFFGYKVSQINNVFDEEMLYLTRVFNRHFNNKISLDFQDFWLISSDLAINNLIRLI